jgi:DNA repair protein RAD50
LDKEINEGGAALANLRENRRIRKLQSDIQATQKEIDSCDLEGAAKAKRNFEEKYQPEKDRENEMQQRVTYPHLPQSSISRSPLECSHRRRADLVESAITKTRKRF